MEKQQEQQKTPIVKQPIAILFAYNGSCYAGLERIKGSSTGNMNMDATLSTEQEEQQQSSAVISVEQALFKAFPKDVVSLTHISRASLTAPGEHAAKQVISLSFTGPYLPTAEQINQHLPQDITVFKIHKVEKDFSARRTCEARTVEFLIPTYAFAAPPESTEYCNKPEDEDELTLPTAGLSEMPKGGLFETKRRKHQSVERRHTFVKGGIAAGDEDGFTYPTDNNLHSAQPHVSQQQHRQSVIASVPKKKGWRLFVENFIAMFKPKKQGSELLKQSLAVTLTRRAPEPVTEEKEEPFTSTLRRSLSHKRRTVQDVLQQDILEREQESAPTTSNHHNTSSPLAFEPLDIPAPNEKQIMEIKAYRMSEKKYATLVSTLALFNGTHNFHNYIPGSVQDDSRCFVNIYNIDAAPLEMHEGMEWIRIKVQANAFARDQVRRMMSMLILVTRTNTPRSALGNSFGFSKIDIPETPEGFQILDEPHYNNYNAEAASKSKTTVRFGDVDDAVQAFRARQLHAAIYAREGVEMRFEGWLRQLDDYSFMYCHFLNARGVFTKPRFFPKEHQQMQMKLGKKMSVVGEEEDLGAAVAEMLERNGVLASEE